jgi:uncharacterized Zn finger protein
MVPGFVSVQNGSTVMELKKRKSKKGKDASFKSLRPEHLKRLAGGISFERGIDYFEDGRVVSLVIDGATAAATVEGNRAYKVRMWLDKDSVGGECTCPAYANSGFCKHCAAVGLAVIDSLKDDNAAGAPRKTGRGKPKTKTVTMDDLRAFLKDMDKNRLVEIIVEHALGDDFLREGLITEKMKSDFGGKVDLEGLKGIIDHIVRTDYFVDYHSAYDYYRSIDQAVDCIEQLLKDKHPAEAVELSEYALAVLEEQMNNVDSSDGYFIDILDRLQDLHLAACKKAKPDTEQLAQRLFEWEMRTEFDTFYNALEAYAGVLGKKGIEKYRELAEKEWSKVEAFKPGDRDRRRAWENYRIRDIMESLARISGDIEAQVEVRKRDLYSAYQ